MLSASYCTRRRIQMTTRRKPRITWRPHDPGIGATCARCGHVGNKAHPVLWRGPKFNAASDVHTPAMHTCMDGFWCRARVAERKKEKVQ